jgi:hypothetical protein
VKTKKNAKLKPPKAARDDHSIFSVSEVPSNVLEPEKSGPEHYMEYFEDLTNGVNKKKQQDDHSHTLPKKVLP